MSNKQLMVSVLDLLDAGCILQQRIIYHPALGDIEAREERILIAQIVPGTHLEERHNFTLVTDPEFGEATLYAAAPFYDDSEADAPLVDLLKHHGIAFGVAEVKA